MFVEFSNYIKPDTIAHPTTEHVDPNYGLTTRLTYNDIVNDKVGQYLRPKSMVLPPIPVPWSYQAPNLSSTFKEYVSSSSSLSMLFKIDADIEDSPSTFLRTFKNLINSIFSWKEKSDGKLQDRRMPL